MKIIRQPTYKHWIHSKNVTCPTDDGIFRLEESDRFETTFSENSVKVTCPFCGKKIEVYKREFSTPSQPKIVPNIPWTNPPITDPFKPWSNPFMYGGGDAIISFNGNLAEIKVLSQSNNKTK